MANAPVRVLVVDGHHTFAELLGVALAGQPGLVHAGHAGTVAEALPLVADLAPDVVLLDAELPDADGIAAIEAMRSRNPRARFVVLTARAEPALVGRAAAAGASGVLTKNGSLGDVLHAVRTAHTGAMTVSSHLLSTMLKSARAAESAATLSAREHEVLRLMADGMDARAIARRLDISMPTSGAYVMNVLAKLDARNRLEAVAVATRRGLLAGADRDQRF